MLHRPVETAGIFRNYGEIDFITHSMGGLVSKRMLGKMNTPDDYSDLEKIHSVIYISFCRMVGVASDPQIDATKSAMSSSQHFYTLTFA